MDENLKWEKVFSGKFIFTVITSFVFAYAVHTKMLNGEQVYGVIMLVVAFYFNRNEPSQNKENGNEKNDSNTTDVKPS